MAKINVIRAGGSQKIEVNMNAIRAKVRNEDRRSIEENSIYRDKFLYSNNNIMQ